MCPLVDGLAPGSVVVARLATGSPGIPAIVASGDLRVLWVGGFMDVVDKAYKDAASVVAMRALVHRWVQWLSEPKP
jgi:hypothetical protein